MKKLAVLFVLVLFVLMLAVSFAPEAQAKGGVYPCMLSLLCGPRIGLEYNEGKPVRTQEWLQIIGIGTIWILVENTMKNGCTGCIYSFAGPRVGYEANQRKIRIVQECLPVFLPLLRVLPAIEAFQGKTMTEIANESGLNISSETGGA